MFSPLTWYNAAKRQIKNASLSPSKATKEASMIIANIPTFLVGIFNWGQI